MYKVKIITSCSECDYCDRSNIPYCNYMSREIPHYDVNTNGCPLPDATNHQVNWLTLKQWMSDWVFIERKLKEKNKKLEVKHG